MRVLALGAALLLALACTKIAGDPDQVVALEVIVPDSILVGDTLLPLARALNNEGDSVAAEIFWASLDTAILQVLDTASGETLGKAAGTGRLQARVGALRSNPQGIIVREP